MEDTEIEEQKTDVKGVMEDIKFEEEKSHIGKDEAQLDAVEYWKKKLTRLTSKNDSLEDAAMDVPGMDAHKRGQVSAFALFSLAFQTVGVVYGDMGTSPLYVFSSAFPSGLPHPENDLMGALSLILYTLILLPLCKYVLIVLWANDDGEGGTFALFSLISRHANVGLVTQPHPTDRRLSTYKLQAPSHAFERAALIKERIEKSVALQNCLLLLALLGTSMIIGDGTLTPAISVLSAVSGLKVAIPDLSQDVVVITSIIILVGLFLLQRFGTSKVGFAFAPALSIWFICIGITGLYNIINYDPLVFRALNPKYIFVYFKNNGKQGWKSLGGIVLCITGTEAMFADLGHFSVRSIQVAFTALVLPSLILCYAGQASYLQYHPEDVVDTFYKSIPGFFFWPIFVVATLSAIIASQAMISASFSVMKMAESLGCFPRVNIVHTSKRFPGQIYIPEINWLIMIATVSLTAGFRSTTQLGNAYGIAVVATMFVTTTLVTLIMIMIWQINIFLALCFFALFGSIELFYLSSVLCKVPEGGWVPLAFSACLLTLMYVWHYGKRMKYQYEVRHKLPMEWISEQGPDLKTVRVPRIGLMYNELIRGIPGAFHQFITNLPAAPSIIVLVCIRYLPVATVTQAERVLIRRLGPRDYHMYRCIVRYGYRDTRTETTESFEKILIEMLERFLLREVLGKDFELGKGTETCPSKDSLLMPLLTCHTDAEESEAEYSRLSCPIGMSAYDEIDFLHSNWKTGIVYMLAHGDVRAKKDSFFFKKLVINYFYAFLSRNCRPPAETMNIPPNKLFQLGMTYFV